MHTDVAKDQTMKIEIISTRIDLDSSGGIPVELKVKQPNQTTLNAIQELEERKGITVQSTADLFSSLSIDLADT